MTAPMKCRLLPTALVLASEAQLQLRGTIFVQSGRR